uniref:Uncharacterized protein n=1 Tax=Strigamia maritima TaxID=126957 RepID=T1IU67_STRMM
MDSPDILRFIIRLEDSTDTTNIVQVKLAWVWEELKKLCPKGVVVACHNAKTSERIADQSLYRQHVVILNPKQRSSRWIFSSVSDVKLMLIIATRHVKRQPLPVLEGYHFVPYLEDSSVVQTKG